MSTKIKINIKIIDSKPIDVNEVSRMSARFNTKISNSNVSSPHDFQLECTFGKSFEDFDNSTQNTLFCVCIMPNKSYSEAEALIDSKHVNITILSDIKPNWIEETPGVDKHPNNLHHIQFQVATESLGLVHLKDMLVKAAARCKWTKIDYNLRKVSTLTHMEPRLDDASSHITNVNKLRGKTNAIQFKLGSSSLNANAISILSATNDINGIHINKNLPNFLNVYVTNSASGIDALVNNYDVILCVQKNIDTKLHENHPNIMSIPESIFENSDALSRIIFLVNALSESAEYSNRFAEKEGSDTIESVMKTLRDLRVD